MTYAITGRDLQAFRRCVEALAGLINGRGDVPAQFHTDVEQAREALGNATELSAPTPATAPAPAPTLVPPDDESENNLK